MKQNLFTFSLSLILILFLPSLSYACTLFAAQGKLTTYGGLVLVKNRDWFPDHHQELRLIRKAGAYQYLGLFAVDGPSPGLKAGVNEKGLVIVSAAADAIPKAVRMSISRTKGLTGRLLSTCAGVDEVLTKGELFYGPTFLMVADATKIAMIEIGLEGKYATEVIQNGIYSHTNHYLIETMLPFNLQIPRSSKERLTLIKKLFSQTPPPYDLPTFLKFSTNQENGPDNSIFRIGGGPKKPRTLAIWAMETYEKEPPLLYVKIMNPGEQEKIFRANLREIFSGNSIDNWYR